MGRLATAPTTPASSNASRAAECCGDLPFLGQPFGMTQRRVSREVMSMNCGREPRRSAFGANRTTSARSELYRFWTHFVHVGFGEASLIARPPTRLGERANQP